MHVFPVSLLANLPNYCLKVSGYGTVTGLLHTPDGHVHCNISDLHCFNLLIPCPCYRIQNAAAPDDPVFALVILAALTAPLHGKALYSSSYVII